MVPSVREVDELGRVLISDVTRSIGHAVNSTDRAVLGAVLSVRLAPHHVVIAAGVVVLHSPGSVASSTSRCVLHCPPDHT